MNSAALNFDPPYTTFALSLVSRLYNNLTLLQHMFYITTKFIA